MAIEGVVWSERRSTLLAGTFCGSHVGYGFFSRLFSDCAFLARDKLFVRVFVEELIVTGTSLSVAWFFFFCKLQDIFVLTVPRFVGMKVVKTDKRVRSVCVICPHHENGRSVGSDEREDHECSRC